METLFKVRTYKGTAKVGDMERAFVSRCPPHWATATTASQSLSRKTQRSSYCDVQCRSLCTPLRPEFLVAPDVEEWVKADIKYYLGSFRITPVISDRYRLSVSCLCLLVRPTPSLLPSMVRDVLFSDTTVAFISPCWWPPNTLEQVRLRCWRSKESTDTLYRFTLFHLSVDMGQVEEEQETHDKYHERRDSWMHCKFLIDIRLTKIFLYHLLWL